MKKIDSNSVLDGFIATALIGLSVILIALGKSTSEWQFTKANSAHFEVKGKTFDFGESEKVATSFQQSVAEKFAAVDTFVYKNGAYFLIKDDRIFAGYTDLCLQAEAFDVAKLKSSFKKISVDNDHAEFWVRK